MTTEPLAKPAVLVEGVGKIFDVGRGRSAGTVVALDDIRLSVATGEFVSLIGPSGCGKSTLLRLIADLDQPSVGDITGRGSIEFWTQAKKMTTKWNREAGTNWMS